VDDDVRPGSKPSASRGDYPSGDELPRAVEQGFERLRRQAAEATPERLARPSTNPCTKDALPTVGDAVAFLLTGHLAVHLGHTAAGGPTAAPN
jgi:hypothetical protein